MRRATGSFSLRQSWRSARSEKEDGFTLLELMIVLVIMVSIMAVAWPRITGQLSVVGPREAAVQLKGDLESAREEAVVSGEPWALRIERGKRNYELGPVEEFRERHRQLVASPTTSSGVDTLIGLTADDTLLSADPTVDSTTTSSLVAMHELPAGMVFDDGIAHATQDANQVRAPQQQTQSLTPTIPNSLVPATPPIDPRMVAQPPIQPVVAQNWKYVVIFQPDGRTTESEVRLREELSNNKIRLRIRGFTGGVTIDDVERYIPQAVAAEGLDELDPRLLDGNLMQPANPLDALQQFRANEAPVPGAIPVPAGGFNQPQQPQPQSYPEVLR